jgi:ABC-type dipeptide/oligopeptide/nickel transport system ATPase component
MPLLDVKNLQTRFYTGEGVVHAVNDVSFHVNDQETVGIVGESGSGKSMTMLSVMRLIPQPPGKITQGEVMFEDQDLLKLSLPAIRRLRGNRISMIFQDPMTSLNPVLTVEKQLTESIRVHMKLDKSGSPRSRYPTAGACGHSGGERSHSQLSPPVFGRHAAAGDDCHGPVLRPQAVDCR